MTHPIIDKRLADARYRLTGQKRARGTQAWFRREYAERTGEEPSKSTIHRWLSGKHPIPHKAMNVIEELEKEAAEVSDRKRAFKPPRAPSETKRGREVLDRAEEIRGAGGPEDDEERDILVVADWLESENFAETGRLHGLTRERVRQIVEESGVRA